jgi:hypothetical protein
MADITLTQVDADLARLNQYNLALEGFQRVMEGREIVTGPLAVAMRIALEDAEVDQDDDKGVTGKDIATGFKKVAITVKNIIQWLLRTIGKLVEKLGLGMQRLGEKGRKVKQALAEMPEAARASLGKGDASEIPQDVLQPEMLAIAGEFVGNDIEAINNVIKMGTYINGDFPKMFDQIMGTTEQLARKHMNDDTSEEFFKALAATLSTGLKRPTVPFSGDHFAAAVANEEDTINTVPLMGDQGFVMPDPKGSGTLNENNPIEQLRGYFVWHFGDYNTKSTGSVDIPVVDFATISKITDLIDKSINDNIDSSSELKSLMDKRVSATNALLDEMAKGDGPGARGEIAMCVGVMLQRFADCLTNIHGWYARTLTQELGYLNTCIDVASKGK